MERSELAAHQLARLNDLLARILPANEFYARKFAGRSLPLKSLDELRELPLTTKEELVIDGTPHAVPANLTWPLDRYVRYHQTSGTHGRPLPVFDTAEDWQWWVDGWQYVLDAAEVTAADRAMLAFSFGPFIGFWTAHDALVARGALVIPGGGMNSRARLDLIERTGATALFCTPTYALHLVEIAEECKFNLARCDVMKIVVAGEPGGSIESVRERIETAWQARVIDHAGASEVGPWGYASADRRGIHILESEFIAEFIDVETGGPASAGGLSHLILTSLGRPGLPIIRYRTGDLARPAWPEGGPNRFVLLEGGVLGRADDMMIIRGVNVFPTAVESILRSFPEVVEYRMTARKQGAMDELSVEVEDHLQQPARIAEELYLRIGLRIDVTLAPPLSLPRFEGKGGRFVDQRRVEQTA
ncbi:MAG: phenylacetate--CoA ligase family protein [Pirellulales bacterium]|nr:phenylacetate--CoA ligase family protein [Pirellulales bacterium]